MNFDLEQKLVNAFPDLFADRKLPETQSLMSFGCECDDGWYAIIAGVCACINEHVKNGGWKHEEPYRFFQIKEKYAGLRIYDNGHDEYIAGVIRLAEMLSHVTCEVCGKPGRTCCAQGGYWVKTVCPEHALELNYRTVEKNEEL